MAAEWGPELEVLDQLQGGDMPLKALLGLFNSAKGAQGAIRHLLADGMIEVLDQDKHGLALWQWDNLCRDPAEWDRSAATLQLALTPKGSKYIG